MAHGDAALLGDPTDESDEDIERSLMPEAQPIDRETPGLFAGITTGPAETVLSHALSAAAGATSLGTQYYAAGKQFLYGVPEEAPESTAEQWLRTQADALMPKAGTQGAATRVLSGVAGFATDVAAGAPAGPLGMVASAGLLSAYQSYHQHVAEGVDPDTAQRLALSDGITNGLFAAVPGGTFARSASLAERTLASIAVGAPSNMTIGAISRYANHRILEAGGYPQLADEYRALDANSLITDAAMGAVPAGLHIAGSAASRVLRTIAAAARTDGRVRDAASTAADARAVRALAPGIPTSADSMAAHSQALETALDQHLSGQPVDVSETPIAGAEFLTPPQDGEAFAHGRDLFAQELQAQATAGGLDHTDDQVQRVARTLGLEVPEAPKPQGPESLGTPEQLRALEPAEGAAPRGGLTSGFTEATPEELAAHTGAVRERVETPLGERMAQEAAKEITPDEATEMRRMAANAGWFQEGGRILRADVKENSGVESAPGGTSRVVGRTEWIANEPWFKDELGAQVGRSGRLGKNDRDYPTVIEEGLAGRPLRAKERRNFEAFRDIARDRLAQHAQRDAADRAEFEAASPTYREEQDGRARRLMELASRLDVIDHDTYANLAESWKDDEPDTLDRIESELKAALERTDQRPREASSRGDEGGGGLELAKSPSSRELEEQERSDRARGAVEREHLRTLAERQRADEDRSTFGLTGSDRAADLNPRQGDLVQQVLESNPDARVIGANGDAIPAQAAVHQVDALEAQGRAEAEPALNAAVDCAMSDVPF